ncbi:hypothetical protein Hanom_Chr12g01160851 [Helianthus anomalus]
MFRAAESAVTDGGNDRSSGDADICKWQSCKKKTAMGMKLRGNYGQKYVILKCLREE